MGAARFERATSSLLARCSGHLSYAPQVVDEGGWPGVGGWALNTTSVALNPQPLPHISHQFCGIGLDWEDGLAEEVGGGFRGVIGEGAGLWRA